MPTRLSNYQFSRTIDAVSRSVNPSRIQSPNRKEPYPGISPNLFNHSTPSFFAKLWFQVRKCYAYSGGYFTRDFESVNLKSRDYIFDKPDRQNTLPPLASNELFDSVSGQMPPS
jgi:hypothetical protein